METIIIQTDNAKAKALKQFLKAFEISFKVSKAENKSYKTAFVAKILKTRNEPSTRIDPNNLWESIL